MAVPTDKAARQVRTGRVRFSFLAVFEPKETPNGDEKYSVTLMVPKSDTATIQALRDAEAAAIGLGISTKWGGKKPRDLKSVIRDADAEGMAEDYPEFEGHWFVNCSATIKYPPFVVDNHRNPTKDVKSGDYGRAALTAYPYNVDVNKGVAFGLDGIQKLASGEALGGSGQTSDVFEEEDDEVGENDDLI